MLAFVFRNHISGVSLGAGSGVVDFFRDVVYFVFFHSWVSFLGFWKYVFVVKKVGYLPNKYNFRGKPLQK